MCKTGSNKGGPKEGEQEQQLIVCLSSSRLAFLLERPSNNVVGGIYTVIKTKVGCGW